jgi:hypothetical protein
MRLSLFKLTQGFSLRDMFPVFSGFFIIGFGLDYLFLELDEFRSIHKCDGSEECNQTIGGEF